MDTDPFPQNFNGNIMLEMIPNIINLRLNTVIVSSSICIF